MFQMRKSSPPARSRFAVAASLAGVLLAGVDPAARAQAVTGVVMDDATRAPLAGATVIATWHGADFGSDVCVWVDVATTDAQGRYEIPAPSLSLSQRFIESVSPRVNPYKAGYRYAVTRTQEALPPALHMAPVADATTRFYEIRGKWLSAGCLGAPVEQAAKLRPLYKALFSDASDLPHDVQDRGALLTGLCMSIASTDRPGATGTVGSQIASVPGQDARTQAALARIEPRCLALLERPKPVIRQVIVPNPSPGVGGAAAPAEPPK